MPPNTPYAQGSFAGEVLARLDSIDGRLDKIDNKLDKFDERIRASEQGQTYTRAFLMAFAAVASLLVNVASRLWK